MEQRTRSRETQKQDSGFQRNFLGEKSIQQSLKLLCQIISTSRGPNGKVKMVQNSAGGHLTLTSKSSRLFDAMSFSKSVVKLIITSAQGHLQHFKDGGNFVTLLSTNLILLSLKSGLNRKLTIELFEEMLTMTLNYLNYNGVGLKFRIQISDLKHISVIVKSILSSKPLCYLNENNLEHIIRLVIETFLNTLLSGDNSFHLTDLINIVCFDECIVSDSLVYKGLLIQSPNIQSYSKQDLNLIKINMEGKYGIRCAVVMVSMSGDTEEVMDMKYETDEGTRMENAVLCRLKKFCEFIVKYSVGVVFCQKVVHPKLKKYCREHGVRVVDRLGLQMVNYVIDISGASPLPSFDSVNVESFGWLNSVEHVIVNNKSYLHLISDRPMATLVLCNTEEESLQELKAHCSSALTALRHLLHSPYVLVGGGCWEVHLASVIRNQVLKNKEILSQTFGCSQTTLFSICDVFAHSLEKVAMAIADEDFDNMLDTSSHHIWRVPKGGLINDNYPCGCGIYTVKYSDLKLISETSLVKDSESVLDEEPQSNGDISYLSDQDVGVVDLFSSSINAIQTAVMTATTVLSVNQYIEDVN